MEPIRILLVDDHVLFRKGVAALLASRTDFDVVGEAGNGKEAVEKCEEVQPDIILMDIDMPICNGLKAVRIIKTEMPQVKIIMLTVSDDERDLFEAIKSGAEGYLLKNLEPRKLYAMLEGAQRGEASMSGVLAAKIIREFRKANLAGSTLSEGGGELSSREVDVLRLVAQGLSNREIAEVLSVSENTVKVHVRNTLEKLHLRNRVQAAVYALKEGIFSPESN